MCGLPIRDFHERGTALAHIRMRVVIAMLDQLLTL
jgi:hypothetical protein